ncbi:MAG: hypothetical protein RL653_2000 [Pseudomonadota bacterium]|jgi:hypothetical protein
MTRAAAVGMVLGMAGAAWAELPSGVSSPRVEDRAAAYVALSGRTVGAGALLPTAGGEAWGLQADVAPADAFLQLSAARTVRLLPDDGRVTRATAQVGLDVLATTRGPLSLGVGPSVGLAWGAGPSWLGGFGTLQAGAGIFPVGGAPLFRLPLRAGLGVQSRVGPVDARLLLQLGLDVNVGQPATARTDAVLVLGFLP